MKSKNVDIYFFSGTGNTYQAVKFLKEKLESVNLNQEQHSITKIIVKLFRIEKNLPENINLNHTIGIAFPAAYGFTYPFIRKFLKNLPKTNGTDVFLLVTMGGYSGACLTLSKKLLLQKGYNCLSALELIMPSNLATNSKRQRNFKPHHTKILRVNENNKSILEIPNDLVEKFILNLINDNNHWKTNPIISNILKVGIRYLNPHKYLYKKFPIKVDTSKCIQCGICYNVCPADNIRMYEFPRFENNCEYCLRCYTYCPVKAINIYNLAMEPYKAADLEEIQLDKQ